jgi:two-component system chemotaxis sensor kinase CheA
MNTLLEQFIYEAREFLQGIGEKLMQLEQAPNDADLMVELFRLVHTLKGNSGLFDFPEMTRVLHVGEDLMDAVRNGRVTYSQVFADQLLDAMDFVGILCDEIESSGSINASRATDSARLATALRALILENPVAVADTAALDTWTVELVAPTEPDCFELPLAEIPEAARMRAYRHAMNGGVLHWVSYTPVDECFFQGEDPFFTARQTPDILWVRVVPREAWPALNELDAYRCVLAFQLLSAAPRSVLAEHYRYVPDQIAITAVEPCFVVIPQGDPNGGPVYDDFVGYAMKHLQAGELDALKQAILTMQQLSNPDLWLSSALRWALELLASEPHQHAALAKLIESLRTLEPPDWAAISVTQVSDSATVLDAPKSQTLQSLNPVKPLSEADTSALKSIFASQRQILMLEDHPAWQAGRLQATAAVLINGCKASGDAASQSEIEAALRLALAIVSGAPLLDWLEAREGASVPAVVCPHDLRPTTSAASIGTEVASSTISSSVTAEDEPKFSRRAEDVNVGSKSLKVDQSKIDLLMNLIGEMVVSKNALPYLAQRAEEQFGAAELAREIKAQYAVINRIAEEMQSAIMQVRMMPVSLVFQRFPRMVRDLSRKLGKEVELVLEGEDTQADKNIIESLADPLIHIVRNSLDHGLETPELRHAAGKPESGKLTIRAEQEGDQVLIEIIDDGKGIDPTVVKRKAYEKGVIDETTLERISDRDAVNLVFAAGFSTAEVVSDLSGRGVGMDVVRAAVEKANGSIVLDSVVGQGTRIRIALPLSMAVTQVMIVETDGQIFGMPMDHVVETVRIPRSAIHSIKHSKTTILRGSIVPLKALNALLGLPVAPRANAYDEMAVLVARVGGEAVGLMVDDFHETVEVIQKPLSGVLSNLAAYSGSALMGDGSVLMVLNVKEIL